jgi:uncharacterized membrane protein YccC
MWKRRDKFLAEHELEAEEKEKNLEERVRWFQAVQVAQVAQMAQAAPVSQAAETMKKTLEDLRAEHRIGFQHITAWADEASSALGAAGGEPHPGVEAASVHFRRAPDAGIHRRPHPSPGSNPWCPLGG